MEERKSSYLIILAPGILVIYFILFISPRLCDLSGDSARYLLLGRAISSGAGYVETETPGEPVHTEYGPGLPLVIAALDLVHVRGLNALKFIAVFSLLFGVTLGFWQLALKTRPDRTVASSAAIVLLASSFPFQARFANQVLSDLPYFAMSMFALVLMQSGEEDVPGAMRARVVAGLAMGVAFLFRQVGIALWLGAMAGIFIKRGKSLQEKGAFALAVSVGFLVLAGGWLARNYMEAGAIDPSHLDKLFLARDADPFAGTIGVVGLLGRVVQGLRSYVRETGTVLFDMSAPLVANWVRVAAGIVLVAPALYGYGLRLVRQRSSMEWYVLFYMLIICAWQSHNPRYLIPVLPLFVLYAAAGVENILGLDAPGEDWRGRRALLASTLLGALLAFNIGVFVKDSFIIRGSAQTELRDDTSGPIKWGYWWQWPDMMESSNPAGRAMRYHRLIAASIRAGKDLPRGAVIAARKPRLVAYYSGRKVVQYPVETDPAKLASRLKAAGITYLMLDEVSPEVRLIAGSFIKSHKELFEPVFSIGQTHLIRFKAELVK